MEYNQLLRDEKCRHFKETILNSDNKTKSLWNVVAEIKEHQKTTNIPIEGDPNLLADQFNTFFCENIENGVGNTNTFESKSNIPPSEENLVLKTITKEDILKMGKLLRSKHSSGFDGVMYYEMLLGASG
ncbi:hypothetical protein HHI36_007008 [Cryptolaemus montrouzieri]|uniref:Uncharacterized protein n=1 Tax=Cryptolaemus montrouzieri TaxID=559131 RepID=A0ABD2MNN0_9CUCU